MDGVPRKSFRTSIFTLFRGGMDVPLIGFQGTMIHPMKSPTFTAVSPSSSFHPSLHPGLFMNPTFQETVFEICKKDLRYPPDAYFFLVEALDSTVKETHKKQPDHGRHVSGRELLEGIKTYALDEFGPLTHAVFSEWGIHATQDFGEIVFNLVAAGRLGKTESDSREDFKNAYDFDEAFLVPFEPQRPEIPPSPPVRASRRRKRA